jgi:hypothetical protein
VDCGFRPIGSSDREYIHSLLNEEPLRASKFLVFLTFKEGDQGEVQSDDTIAKARAQARDGLGIGEPFNIFITSSVQDLKTAMEVDKVDPRGCFCP